MSQQYIIRNIATDTVIVTNATESEARNLALTLHNGQTALLMKLAKDFDLIEFIFETFEQLESHINNVSDDSDFKVIELI